MNFGENVKWGKFHKMGLLGIFFLRFKIVPLNGTKRNDFQKSTFNGTKNRQTERLTSLKDHLIHKTHLQIAKDNLF